MTLHYRYGGSTAKRTLGCPGWAALALKLTNERGVKDDASEHANRGSMLHNCCEILERDGIEYEDLLAQGVEYKGFKLTEDLLDTKVVPAMEALDELCDKYGIDTLTTEETIKISDVIGGTLDVYGEGEDVLLFVDYKFGEGIMIDAEDNDQLLFGGWTKMRQQEQKHHLGVWDSTKKVALALIQPADRREEPVDVWEVEVQDLVAFGERFQAAVAIAEDSQPGENLCIGSHCQFCPASGLNDCPAKANEDNFNIEQLRKLDADYVEGSTGLVPILDKKCKDLPALNLEQALDIVAKLEKWTKDVRSFAAKQLEVNSTSVVGWKLVQKRAMKHWVDPEKAANYLKRKLKAKNAMVSTVLTPAAAVKKAKAMGVEVRLDDHISFYSSGTTLARTDDKREAVLPLSEIAGQLKLLDAVEGTAENRTEGEKRIDDVEDTAETRAADEKRISDIIDKDHRAHMLVVEADKQESIDMYEEVTDVLNNLD